MYVAKRFTPARAATVVGSKNNRQDKDQDSGNYRVTQKNGATGHPISLQIFRKLDDGIACKLMNFCSIIC